MTAHLERRRLVWAALSELFLDTEIDVPFIVSSLQASGYSRGDLESIMTREVAPVLRGNVLSTAGVWSGFDLTPIEKRYLAGKARPSLTGWLGLWVIRRDWQQVRGALK